MVLGQRGEMKRKLCDLGYALLFVVVVVASAVQYVKERWSA
jgi:hypothetical protein